MRSVPTKCHDFLRPILLEVRGISTRSHRYPINREKNAQLSALLTKSSLPGKLVARLPAWGKLFQRTCRDDGKGRWRHGRLHTTSVVWCLKLFSDRPIPTSCTSFRRKKRSFFKKMRSAVHFSTNNYQKRRNKQLKTKTNQTSAVAHTTAVVASAAHIVQKFLISNTRKIWG